MAKRPTKIPPALALVGETALLAFLLGGAVSLLAFLLARYGPSGGNWSFKGNGALAAYTVFPAVLAGGWTALVLRARAHRRWLGLGAGAGLVGVLLAALAAALQLDYRRYRSTIPILLLSLLLWVAAAPIAATRIRPGKSSGTARMVPHLLAGIVWLAAALAGLVLIGILIPAGS